MNIDFDSGLLQIWYDWAIVVFAFAIAALLTVVVIGQSNWQTSGLLLKTWMVIAALPVMVLAMARLGVNMAIAEDEPLGYFSIGGFIGSLAAGLAYLYISYRGIRVEGVTAEDHIVTPRGGSTSGTGTFGRY